MRQKIRRLRLVVEQRKNVWSTSSKLDLPKELPSVEEALKDLVAVMNALKTPGLPKTEIMRLRSRVQVADKYQTRFAEYVDYRGTEKRMIELLQKYEELAKREQDRAEKA